MCVLFMHNACFIDKLQIILQRFLPIIDEEAICIVQESAAAQSNSVNFLGRGKLITHPNN